jgi:hypothetical protein
MIDKPHEPASAPDVTVRALRIPGAGDPADAISGTEDVDA